VGLKQPGQSLDFLGYTFRYDRDLYGRLQRYWNLEPSRKALARERDALGALITRHQSYTPLPELIGRVNRHLWGWSNYFRLGYPRKAFWQLNASCGIGCGDICDVAVNGAGVRAVGSACMLICNILDWLVCERFVEEATVARAGCVKSPRPVRRGRGVRRGTNPSGQFHLIPDTSRLYRWFKPCRHGGDAV